MTDVLRRHLRARMRRRARRNLPELATLFVVVVIGFTLSSSFFVASASVLGSLDRFAEENNQEAGSFQVRGVDAAGVPVAPAGVETDGIERVPSADADGPDGSVLRVFAPRTSINLHEVVEGRDLAAEGEVLVDAKYAGAHGLRVGDDVGIGGLQLEVVGFATAPDYVTTKTNELVLQPNPDQFGIAFVPAETFDTHFLPLAVHHFAYDERFDAAEIVALHDPDVIRDSANNSRIQQVIGDSAAPRDLAALIFVIFTTIVVALLCVYHFENRRREATDIATFDRLGLARPLPRHYRVETTWTLVAAWVASTVATALVVRPIMSINGKLYNYPQLETDVGVLAVTAAVSLVVLLAADRACFVVVARQARRGVRARERAPRLTTTGLRAVRDLGLRLRIVKAVRSPREPLALLALVAIVSVFVNFSLLLKTSVDEYVAMLGTDTPYEHMYVLPAPAGDAARADDEPARLTTLYDDEHVAQMVFSVPRDSRFFGAVDGPTVTSAFAEKYGVAPGDVIELSDITGASEHRLVVDAVTSNGSSALVYVPDDVDLVSDGQVAPSVDLLLTASRHPTLHDVAPSVSRSAVVSSGESIVEIIGIQVSLLIAMAVALLAIMLFSIYRFTYGTQEDFVRIMRLNGQPPGVLNRALFGFSVPMILVVSVLASFAAGAMVRGFFDTIMATFVTFVPASDSLGPPLITCSAILVLFGVVLVRSRARLSRS